MDQQVTTKRARTRLLVTMGACIVSCSSQSSNMDGDASDAIVVVTDSGNADGTTAVIDSGAANNPVVKLDSGTANVPVVVPDSALSCRANADGGTTLVFVNQCSSIVHVRGSDIEGADVGVGEFVCRDIGTDTEPLSAKRYWGFIGADPGAEHHTLAEFTFNTDFNDFDWYNISHVDAHNLTMKIEPLDRPNCDVLSCSDRSLLTDCPEVGRLLNSAGDLVSCVSPDRDNGDSEVALHFESCDDAYAWSGDDQHGSDPSPVRACAGEDWAIVFCP